MKIIIIEDETPALNRIKKMVLEVEPSIEILDTADSIEQSVQVIEKHEGNIDLILMDIELADGQSFEIFNLTEVKCPVIFTTAYDEFALKAFKVNSIDYLLKPIDKQELKAAFQKFKSIQKSANNVDALKEMLAQISAPKNSFKERFLVKLGERLISVPANDIAYFLSKDKLTYLITKNNNKYVVDYTLEELGNMLDRKYFFQINRQFIVAINSITNIHNYFNGKLKIQLVPVVEEEVLVSRERAGELKLWLNQ
jgi:two-component system LytT family response regulator